MNHGQRFITENIAVFYLYPNHDDVSATKSVLNLIVQFYIGVTLRQQVGKVRIHL